MCRIFFFALAAEIPSDTKVSLLHLKELFPLERFEGRLPVVIVKHQLYSLINGRTAVDKELVSRFLSFIICDSVQGKFVLIWFNRLDFL